MSDIKPTRIAHIVGKMVGGGVESTIMNYYRNINRHEIQYDFIIDSDSTRVPEEIKKMGGHIIYVPPYQNIFSYQKALRSIFKQNHYEIVHSHLNTLSVFPLFAAKHAGISIRIAHNHSTAGKGEFKKNLLKYLLRPFAKLFATHYCACSLFAGGWLFGNKALVNHEIQIWSNAVDVNKFLYMKDVRNRLRSQMNVENKFVIGHVGRFIHQKNHMFIVEIFNEVHKIKKDTVLILIGDGELLKSVKEKVEKLKLTDSIFFISNTDEISQYYQAMDTFLFPSFYEGLGMVAVEAQISGLPVFASTYVPVEAKICDNFMHISLNESASFWANKILQKGCNINRKGMYELACDAGFEISIEAKKLLHWYKSLLNK